MQLMVIDSTEMLKVSLGKFSSVNTFTAVQAFLEDADSVLAALDQCQAEEKCLMLIKRPKDAARKMLKSHSWANLSVSDPQLYRQFNGLQLSQIQTAQHQLQKVKRSSDQHSVASSNDTDRSEPRRRYISARSKETGRQGHRTMPEGSRQSVTSPDYYSDSSSTASDYQYVGGRRAERSREQQGRRGERYPSIPEDGQEINNNSNKGGNPGGKGSNNNHPMYYSCQDISYASRPDGGGRGRRQGQGQGQEHQGQGQIASDQLYQPRKRDQDAPTHDPGDMMDDGVRSQSLGNLSTGLTLSLVGQRKADSMLDLSSSSPARQQQPPPPRARGSRHRASDGAQYPEHAQSSRDSYPQNNVRSPRDSDPDSAFSPRDPRGFPYPDAQSPPYSDRRRSSNGSYYNNNPHDAGSHNHSHNYARSQQNGYAYSSASTSREQTPQSDCAPPKPKRSLPQVPLVETSERIKRFTEMMRSRMSVGSSTGRSTANSAMSQASNTPQTPLSRQASVTDNGSDCEVSTLLDVRLKDSGSGDSPQKHSDAGGGGGGGRRPPGHVEVDSSWREGPRDGRGGGGGGKYSQHHPNNGHASSRNRTSVHETPQLYGDHSSDSGQTPFTSHSHSSTMDSGYTTNTEGDADSTVLSGNGVGSHLSPPHHHYPQHHPHPHPNHHNYNHHHHHQTPDSRGPPRNLALATARKFSSMQNVSTAHHNGYNHHGNNQHNNYPPNAHHDGPSSDVNGNRQQPPLQYRGPAPVRAQHSVHGTDGSTADHRRSWDLAQSFKSLDFQPVAQSEQIDRRHSQDEALLKPQAVTVNSSVKPVKSVTPRRATDLHVKNTSDSVRHSLPNGHSAGSWQENPNANSENGMNTLPGHWKYGNASHNAAISNGNTNSVQRTGSKTTPISAPPTLFQLSQSYDLCSVKFSLPAQVSVKDVLTLASVQVSLPAANSPGPLHSPQGRCAQLGGPGSAFRPVRTAPGTGQITAGVTGVGSVGEQFQQLCFVGDLQTGDVLVELNGWYCLNSDHASVQRVLENCQGEVTLGIARKKDESLAARLKQLEQSLHSVESEVQRLTQEVAKKDNRILELSTMLPWKNEEGEAAGSDKLVLESEEGAFVIGDNEFVV
nr:hypothetical protein BaRGS_003894 [Batillaria attramentaria]